MNWNKIAAQELVDGWAYVRVAATRPVSRPAHLRYVDCPEAINRADCLGRAEFHFSMARLYRNRAQRGIDRGIPAARGLDL